MTWGAVCMAMCLVTAVSCREPPLKIERCSKDADCSPDTCSDSNQQCATSKTASPNASQWPVTTLAGSVPGYADGIGTSAEFRQPAGVAVDRDGVVFVADTGNNRIRKISITGAVTTVAGNGEQGFSDGSVGATGTARFAAPQGITPGPSGFVYVADSINCRIRVIDESSGDVTTLAGNGTPGDSDGTGGPMGTSEFRGPWGVAVGGDGIVYMADTGNNRIRKRDALGNVTTLAGNGTAGYADASSGRDGQSEFDLPASISMDIAGHSLIADYLNDRIRRVDSSGNVDTFTGTDIFPVTVVVVT